MTLIDKMRPRPGLRVLVTAGASGIGAAIARGFIEAGASVMICDIDTQAIESLVKTHPDVAAVVADVADEVAVARLFDELTATLGGLDVVINNAGIAGPTGPIESLDVDDIRRTLDVDLVSQFLVVRQAVPLLRRAGEGAIINISSVAGRLGYGLRTPYAAAKWGVVGFSASLAKELGPEGIRVNAILPGFTRGPRIARVFADRAAATCLSAAEIEADFVKQISLRRMVEPDDVAAMALFLASPAGANISGQAISVCGNLENI